MARMLRRIYYTSLSILVIISTYLYFSNRNLKQKVLAESVELLATSTPIPSTSPSPSPTPTPVPTVTTTPKPPAVQKYSSQQINSFIESFAGQYAVSSHVLRYIATCESSFNPLALKGKYAGLFQFDARTWKTFRVKIGEDSNPDLRFNAEEAVQTAAYALSQGRATIWPNCAP
jgi:soluble lytic murein transglycosylase-like protein